MNTFEDKTASAAFVPATAETELIRINIPSGQMLVLTHFANQVDDARAWGYAIWNIIADGVSVRSYTEIKDQYGTFNQMREIPFGFITAKRDLVITAYHTDPANTFILGTSIKGAYLQNV